LAEKAAKGLQRKGRQMDPNETQVALQKKIQNRTNQPTITEKKRFGTTDMKTGFGVLWKNKPALEKELGSMKTV